MYHQKSLSSGCHKVYKLNTVLVHLYSYLITETQNLVFFSDEPND